MNRDPIMVESETSRDRPRCSRQQNCYTRRESTGCAHGPGSSTCGHLVVFGLGGNLRRRDRKSTRLNSSHLVISYAVFCLKKKKKKKKIKLVRHRCLY